MMDSVARAKLSLQVVVWIVVFEAFKKRDIGEERKEKDLKPKQNLNFKSLKSKKCDREVQNYKNKT